MTTAARRWGARVTLVIVAHVLFGPVAGIGAAAGLLWLVLGQPTRVRALSLAGLGFVIAAIGWLTEGGPLPSEVVVFTSDPGRLWIDGVTRASMGVLIMSFAAGEEMPSRSSAGGLGVRLPEAERLRAIGIVAVVLIHGLPFRPPLTYVLDYWLSDTLRFAVAVLFFVSGWLIPGRSIDLAWVRRRLVRLVPPYLVATSAVMVLARLTPAVDPRPVWESILLGRAAGPYYYVFVLVVLTMLTPAMGRLGVRGRWALLAVALPLSLWIELENLSLVWHNHLPLTWLPWYLAGWQLRPHRESLAHLATRWHVTAAGITTLVLVGLMMMPIETTGRRLLTWVGIATTTVALLLLTLVVDRQPAALTRAISERSYLIFLYHPPIVAGLAGTLGNSVLTGIPLWSTAIALVTCLVASQLARVVWPTGARRWLGA